VRRFTASGITRSKARQDNRGRRCCDERWQCRRGDEHGCSVLYCYAVSMSLTGCQYYLAIGGRVSVLREIKHNALRAK
jgi:hypothetical protein